MPECRSTGLHQLLLRDLTFEGAPNVAAMRTGNSPVAPEQQGPIQLGSQSGRVCRPVEMKLHCYAAKSADGAGGFCFCQWADVASDAALLYAHKHIDLS